MKNIPEIIGIVLGAGGVGAFLSYKLGIRQQGTSEFQTIIEEYKSMVLEFKADVVELRKEVDLLRKEINEKKGEIQNLRNQLIIFESSHIDIPVPVWLKDTNGTMLFINSEYEKLILNPINKTAEDYIGHKDSDVWGVEVGKQFTLNDKKVMREKKPIQFTESWHGNDGVVYEGTLIKYPRFLNNNTVIGIGGIIMSIKVEKKTVKT